MEIKDFVDTFTDKAGSYARIGVNKTSAAANRAKLKFNLRNEKKKLDKKYRTLGKLFYEQTKGTDVRRQIVATISKINAQVVAIEELKALIDESNGQVRCEFCGEPISYDAVFCPGCGKSQGIAKFKNDPRTREEIIDDIINSKGLDTDGFISFFNTTAKKYF